MNDELFSDEHDDLIIKYLSGEASYEEIYRLQNWLESSVENKIYFDQIKSSWQASSLVAGPGKFSSAKAWQKVKGQTTEKQYLPKGSWFSQSFYRIAAVLVVGLFLGSLSAYFITSNKIIDTASLASSTEIVTPKGSKSQVILPDGTQVWLNAGSKLTYSNTFNTEFRTVNLEGEAFFKVKTNPDKPFIVNTPEMSVKALGTSFNVKAYPEERTITTTLVEGKVEIESKEQATKFKKLLKPNEKLTYFKEERATTPNKVPKRQETANEKGEMKDKVEVPIKVDGDIDISLYTSWKDDQWIFEGEELDKLLVMLERRYNVTFKYQPELFKDYKVSGAVRKETLEEVLSLLKLTTPIKYKVKDGVVTLEVDRNRSENYKKIIKKN